MRAAARLALALALCALAHTARAHAILVDSQPKQDAVVAGPDVAVALEFNSRIDASRSSLQLAREGGEPKPLALGASPGPNKLVATASGLAPGSYRLRWQVLSVDGHVSRGDVNFKVRAP